MKEQIPPQPFLLCTRAATGIAVIGPVKFVLIKLLIGGSELVVGFDLKMAEDLAARLEKKVAIAKVAGMNLDDHITSP